MKLVKLIILAAVICGAVFLISKFGDIVNTASEEDETQKIDIRQIEVLKPFIDKYNLEWNKAKGWDPNLYKLHLKEAADFKTAGEINSAEYDRLRENISKDVLNRLVKILEPQFRAKILPDSAVRNNMEGIETVGRDRPEGDVQVRKMKDAWNTYTETESFVKKDYSPNSFSLGMNGDCTSWTSFNSHKQSVLSRRDQLRNSELYKEYFTNNTMLSEGLASVDSRVEKCRAGYNTRIADAIIRQYGAVPRFAADDYIAAMRRATTESEWNDASGKFDSAWDEFINSFRKRRQNIGTISTKFKGEVSDNTLQAKVSDVVKKYVVPEKPAKPQKPNFNK